MSFHLRSWPLGSPPRKAWRARGRSALFAQGVCVGICTRRRGTLHTRLGERLPVGKEVLDDTCTEYPGLPRGAAQRPRA
eukprot:7290207-Alexandrium_andersonii.AAC.1